MWPRQCSTGARCWLQSDWPTCESPREKAAPATIANTRARDAACLIRPGPWVAHRDTMYRPQPLRRQGLPHHSTAVPSSPLLGQGQGRLPPQGAAAGPPGAQARRAPDGGSGPGRAQTAAPALVPAQALPCHARARQRLYRAVDHLTFRGALVPLVSSLLKLGTTAISGEGALRHTLLGAAGTSALQSLLGMASAGDREHSFGWVSTLAPSASLAPPPSVARWGISASDADQRRLATIDRWMAVIDAGHVPVNALPTQGRAGLEQAQARLHAQLLAERDQADVLAGVVALAVLLLDGMVAARAQHDANGGRLEAGPYLFILVHIGLSLLLDAAACHWQMKTRSPLATAYPRQALRQLPPSTQLAQLGQVGQMGPAAPGGQVAPVAPLPRLPQVAAMPADRVAPRLFAGGAGAAPDRPGSRGDIEPEQSPEESPEESQAGEGSDSDLEAGCQIAPLPLRGLGPAGGPAAPAARPGGALGPAAGRRQFFPR